MISIIKVGEHTLAFIIKKPNQRNVAHVVRTYNSMKGRGIEVFYNMKRGKIFLADYYRNYNDDRFSKISCFFDDTHLSEISPDYVLQEVEKIKQKTINLRKTEKAIKKEHIKKYREQRRNHFLGRFKKL